METKKQTQNPKFKFYSKGDRIYYKNFNFNDDFNEGLPYAEELIKEVLESGKR